MTPAICPTRTTTSSWPGTGPDWPKWKPSLPHWGPEVAADAEPVHPMCPPGAVTGDGAASASSWLRVHRDRAVILVDHTLSPALPGQAPSGTVTLSKAQQIEDQLAAAAVLTEDGEGQQALELYNKVLTEDPDDPDSARGGWVVGVERPA